MTTFFDEDEEELRLLEQYENEDLNREEDAGHSSDAIDSDLEEKILSMVQYESGLLKKKTSSRPETPVTNPSPVSSPKIVYAPLDTKKSETSGLSASHFLPLENNSDDELYVVDKSSDESSSSSSSNNDDDDDDDDDDDKRFDGSDHTSEHASVVSDVNMAEPPVTRFINLDEDQKYSSGVSSDEEESNLKLQELIKHRVNTIRMQKRLKEAPLLCYNCFQPGHTRAQCSSCKDCGGPKHATYRCDALMYCLRCKKRGHTAANCFNSSNNKKCAYCYSREHITTYCPVKLHSYNGERPIKLNPTKYCYYCSERGHYGDECPDLPPFLSNINTVFSKHSLDNVIMNRHDSRESSPQQRSKELLDKTNHERWPYFFSKGNNNNNRHSSPMISSDDDMLSKLSNKRRKYKEDLSGNGNSHDSRNKKGKGKRQESGRRVTAERNIKSGNTNWKAINMGSSSLPQPTRSGTVNMPTNNNFQQQRQEIGYETNFPRSNIPKPSSSGVIDLIGEESSNNSGGGAYSKKRPRYHGGYNRKR